MIVVAAGAGSFVPRRLPLPGAEGFEGSSLFYAVRKMEQFRGRQDPGRGRRRFGAGLGAQPRADRRQHGAGASARRVPRRPGFGREDAPARRRRAACELIIGQIAGLEGEAERLRSRARSRAATAARRRVACDTLLAFYGLKMELGPIADWGLNLERDLIAVDTEAFETNQPGIFAIGDICTYPGKLKLILSGFHEAALMCQKAFKICFPEKKLIFRYTTSSTDLQKKLGVA